MKTTIKYFSRGIALALILGAGVSCKDFLNVKPQSLYSEDNLFQTAAHAEMSVYGIYNVLLTSDLYGRNVTMYYDMDTDLVQYKGGSGNDVLDGERRSIARYDLTPDTKQVSNAWGRCYRGIENANIAIKNIPNMDLFKQGDKTVQRCYGEALTLRAIFYFDLIRIFGDVPYKFHPSNAGENFDLPRTSRDVIYAKILEDLLEAEQYVPWADEVTFNERITKAAVKGIRARIALYASGYSLRWNLETLDKGSVQMAAITDQARLQELYTIARDECNDIMVKDVHKLNPVFADIWKNICKYTIDQTYKENIFEIGFYSLTGDANAGGYYGVLNGPNVNSNNRPTRGNTSNYMWVMPPFYYMYEETDNRRAATINVYTFSSSGVVEGRPCPIYNCAPGKWRYEWAPEAKTTSASNFNYPLLRYSDVLLMFAEAECRLNNGPTTAGNDALRLVRKRAYPASEQTRISNETYPAAKDAYLDFILDERARELAFEGFRRTDLIRFNKLAARIQWTKDELVNMSNSGVATGANNTYTGSLAINGQPIPHYVWYKSNSSTGLVDMMWTNSSTKPDASWTGNVAWLTNLNASQTNAAGGANTNLSCFAQKFTANQCEIFPIPTAIRDASPAVTQCPAYVGE